MLKKLDIPYQWREEFTKYPHGYTIFEALSKWVDQVNSMVTNINQWNEYLGGFTSTFGEVPPQMEELQREMVALVSSVNSDLTTITDEVTGLADTLLTHLNDYVNYLGSELGEEHVIRTLPNGTKDEVRVSEGKLIKRVKEYVFQNSDIETFNNTAMSNNSFVIFKNPTNVLDNGNFARLETRDRILDTRLVGGYNDVSQQWTYYIAAGTFRVLLPKSYFTNIDEVRNYFAGTTLTYQLAEPVEIPLPNPMTPNTREITRLSEQVDKLTSAIIALGGTII